MEVIGGFEETLERLLRTSVHEELKTDVVEVILDDIRWVRVRLSEKCFDEFFRVRSGVDDSIHIPES